MKHFNFENKTNFEMFRERCLDKILISNLTNCRIKRMRLSDIRTATIRIIEDGFLFFHEEVFHRFCSQRIS